jgi:hypothetical protein
LGAPITATVVRVRNDLRAREGTSRGADAATSDGPSAADPPPDPPERDQSQGVDV